MYQLKDEGSGHNAYYYTHTMRGSMLMLSLYGITDNDITTSLLNLSEVAICLNAQEGVQ